MCVKVTLSRGAGKKGYTFHRQNVTFSKVRVPDIQVVSFYGLGNFIG